MDPQMLDLEGNLVRSASAVRQAVEAGASFVVLPELVTSGYMFGSADELQAVALGVDDSRLDIWRRALAGSAHCSWPGSPNGDRTGTSTTAR